MSELYKAANFIVKKIILFFFDKKNWMSTCENRNMKRLIMLDGIFGFSAPYLKGIFSLKKKKI